MRATCGFLVLAWLAIGGPARAAPPGVRVTVTRAPGATGSSTTPFRRRASVWVFERSATDLEGRLWRPQSWTVETPGVRLAHAGHYDVLTAGGAALGRVRIRMRPFAQPLRADYTPALHFSDGGLAFYTGHFRVLPMASLAAAEALPADLNGVDLPEARAMLTLADPGGRLLLGGGVRNGTATLPLGDAGTYVYAGTAPMIERPAFAGVIDGGLPEWVRAELDNYTPRVMALYAERLGAPAGGRPMALVAWGGAERSGWSLGGSVLQGMVVMQISGKVVAQPSPEVLARMRWFIGHESAHFWMGQTVHYTHRSESWITEGSADIAAIRANGRLVPGYDMRAELQRELDECLRVNGAGEPLSTAEERGENRASYGCGAMLLLAAEGAARRRDPNADAFGFLRALIDENRADGEVTRDDWLAQFQVACGDAALTAEVRGFVDTGVADPLAFWAHLFTATGVGFNREGDALRLS